MVRPALKPQQGASSEQGAAPQASDAPGVVQRATEMAKSALGMETFERDAK